MRLRPTCLHYHVLSSRSVRRSVEAAHQARPMRTTPMDKKKTLTGHTRGHKRKSTETRFNDCQSTPPVQPSRDMKTPASTQLAQTRSRAIFSRLHTLARSHALSNTCMHTCMHTHTYTHARLYTLPHTNTHTYVSRDRVQTSHGNHAPNGPFRQASPSSPPPWP